MSAPPPKHLRGSARAPARSLRVLQKRLGALPLRARLALLLGAGVVLALGLAASAAAVLAARGRGFEMYRDSGRFRVQRWRPAGKELKLPGPYGISAVVVEEVLGYVTEFIAGGMDVDWAKLSEEADREHMHGRGIGRQDGKPLWTPTPFDFSTETEAMKRVAHTKSCFNKRRSNSLELTRAIPDVRAKSCKNMWYYDPKAIPGIRGSNDDKGWFGGGLGKEKGHVFVGSDSNDTKVDVSTLTLPEASVVFVMFNEPLSPLLRSIYTVLNRTPPQLLREIIIVDDGSDADAPWLAPGGEFETHIGSLPKVKLARLKGRNGLMRARNVGIALATAETFVVLDSHIEVNTGWMEPLMARIAEGKAEGVQRVVVPAIDSIHADNFKYTAGGIDILGHSWTLGQTGVYRPHSVVGTAPMRSPIMAGGLLAFDRDWFNELGYYDPLMRLWGGEESEISFRIWQCGGTLECVPCSRVGHIFRSPEHWQGQVYKVPGEEVTRNKLRASIVWMDEYQELVKLASAPLPKGLEIGSLDYMKGVRKRLQCKPYSWYIHNIFPEILPSAERLMGAMGEGSLKAHGFLRSPSANACVDTLNKKSSGESISAYPCHGLHGTQALVAGNDKTIVVAELTFSSCLTREEGFAEANATKLVLNGKCDDKNRLQHWVSYHADNKPGWIYEAEAEGGSASPKGCLTLMRQGEADKKSAYSLRTMACETGNVDQLWEWESLGSPDKPAESLGSPDKPVAQAIEGPR